MGSFFNNNFNINSDGSHLNMNQTILFSIEQRRIVYNFYYIMKYFEINGDYGNICSNTNVINIVTTLINTNNMWDYINNATMNDIIYLGNNIFYNCKIYLSLTKYGFILLIRYGDKSLYNYEFSVIDIETLKNNNVVNINNRELYNNINIESYGMYDYDEQTNHSGALTGIGEIIPIIPFGNMIFLSSTTSNYIDINLNE
jgi:hypothetical protein